MIDWLRRADAPLRVLVAGHPLPIVLRRHSRARRLTLRLSPDGSEARLCAPPWARTADAIAFAQGQAAWLAAQLAACPPRVAPAPGASIAFRGIAHRLDHDPAHSRRIAAREGALAVGGPAESLAPRLTRWLRAEAKRLIAADLGDYSARAGLPAPALALSSARGRWGSCSARGIVRINWRLVMAPDAVRRSVVAHEVAHLLHFDHSPAFHAALARLYEGDIAEANRWLRTHGRALHAVL